VVESYGLFLSALILVGGLLGDLYGRRLIFVSGVALFAVASAACGLATGAPELIIARSIQGVGAALLVPGSLAIISASFDQKDRGSAIGTWSGFTAMTTALGPVLGGWLVAHASWRWVFFLNIPLAAAVIAISLWRIPESRSGNHLRMDWLGAVLATLGLGGIVTGFIESTDLGWGHPLVFGSASAGLCCLAVFVLVEARAGSPLVPLSIFSNPGFAGANLLTLFLYAAIGMFFFLFPLNLIQVQQYSSTKTGAAILPFILLMFVLSRWSGGLVAHFGARLPLVIGPLIAASGFVLFALPSVAHNYWTSFFPAILVLGLGMAVTVAPLTIVVMNAVGEDRVGTASGINNAVARVAGVLAIAVLGIAMVFAFRSHLNHSLARLNLPQAMLHEIQSNENRIGGLQAPAALDSETRQAVDGLIRDSFVYGFRVVILMCAGLCVVSAVMAMITIPGMRDRSGLAAQPS
jgi:EmrB/QacA subfamily drug resistance transporter